MSTSTDSAEAHPEAGVAVAIRDAVPDDRDGIVALDEEATGSAKPDYWRDIFNRYVEEKRSSRFFLVAEDRGEIVGFIIGEVRAWEFGSPPCGWVFEVIVAPGLREQGVGSRLLNEMCARFSSAGVNTVRTMIARSNKLVMSFFRSLGLSAGPYVQLEMRLDESPGPGSEHAPPRKP